VRELWVGFYRKESGRPSITWPESVDEALCFGWIDGVRKGVDDERTVTWWVVSAKKDDTRRRRVKALIAAFARGKRL
jgi:uncharacterized protein YdeI (YjbR/CyaY-like superfamily)